MRSLLLLGFLFCLLGADTPDYLVRIAVDGPRNNNLGTGSLVDPEYILTCNHNVARVHNFITVRFENGDEVEAEVFKRSPAFDLCLLKLNEVRYETPLKLADQRKVNAGQTITVLGYEGTDKLARITGEVYPTLLVIGGTRGGGFRFDGKAEQGVSGGPALIGGELVGVETGWFRIAGVRCTNTPAVRTLLKEIP